MQPDAMKCVANKADMITSETRKPKVGEIWLDQSKYDDYLITKRGDKYIAVNIRTGKNWTPGSKTPERAVDGLILGYGKGTFGIDLYTD